jgi:hypothetical protein
VLINITFYPAVVFAYVAFFLDYLALLTLNFGGGEDKGLFSPY